MSRPSLAYPCFLPRRRAGAVTVMGALALAVGFGAVGPSGCATPPPVVAPGLALKRVVIYRNGVGYFERAGHVQSSSVRFRVRKDEVGDFLATLAVLERGGSSVRSASFPLEVDDQAGALPPSPGPGRPGVPLHGDGDGDGDGDDAAAPPAPRKSDDLRTVVMSLDGQEHDLQVGYIAATPVWRPSYRLVLDKDGAGLQAWGIVQNLSGEDWKNVSLSLIAEAPLAFDAALATPVVPPRPIVSDAGEVIAVVPHSETSLGGSPPPPPAPAPAMSAAAPPPQEEEADEAPAANDARKARKKAGGAAQDKRESARAIASKIFNAKPGGMATLFGRTDDQAPPPDFSGRTRNLSALAAVAVSAGSTRYEIPVPVNVPDKTATMVMLLDRRVPGEAIALFAPDPGVPESASHPFRVARFTNKTGGLLERGPLAIFSEGAFLGQGMTDPLPDGATATVPFALERSLAVDVSRDNHEEGARLLRIEGGALTVARDAVWLTKYRVRNGADRPAKLLLKHGRVVGARLRKPPAGTEDNVGTGSALVPVSAGARATVDITVDERQESAQGLDWLSPLADDAVRAYLADPHADAAVVPALKAAWEIRATLVQVTEQQQKHAVQAEELRRATEETRANLKALEKNAAAADLRAKLTRRLAADSARLDEVSKKLVELGLRIREQQVRFNEALRSIKLSRESARPADE